MIDKFTDILGFNEKKKCFLMNTNKSSIGPVVLEIATYIERNDSDSEEIY